jgi:RuvA, C-terminal domain
MWVSALINLGYNAEAKRAVDSVNGFDDKDGLEILIRKSLAIILGESRSAKGGSPPIADNGAGVIRVQSARRGSGAVAYSIKCGRSTALRARGRGGSPAGLFVTTALAG